MTKSELLQENEELRRQMMEARETLDAIRKGEADAVIVKGRKGYSIYTINGVDRQYRLFLDEMPQGAVMLSAEGAILYQNRRFSEMLCGDKGESPTTGKSFHDLIVPAHRPGVNALLDRANDGRVSGIADLTTVRGQALPVLLAVNSFIVDGDRCYCITALDLSGNEQPAPLSAPTVRQRHVLVICVNRDIVESLNVLLSDCTFRVSIAVDAKTGIEQALNLLPDVAIIDLSQPRGMNAAATIRAALGPEIFMIALCRANDPADTVASGFDAHLVKPLNPQALLKLLNADRATERM